MPDERPGIFDRIKAFFGVTACIGMGIFMLAPPAKVLDEMRDEISDGWRVGLGIGFISFGALFGLTVLFSISSSRGGQAIAARLKGLLLAAVCSCFLALIVFGFGKDVLRAFQLQERGKAASAQIVQRHMNLVKDNTIYSYTISFDGYRATLRLPGSPSIGSRLSVLYLPEEPEIVLPGESGEGMLKILERKVGLWPSIGYSVAALVCLICVFGGIIRFFVGKRPGQTVEVSV